MSEDYKAQASYKFGTNGQAMLNLRGDSVAELHFHVAEAAEGEFVQSLSHLDQTLQAGGVLAGAGAVAGPPAQQGYQLPAQGGYQAPPPQPTAQPPAQQGYQQTPAPTCPHGTRKFVTGVGAKGPWAAWFCPTAKGTPGACAPDWTKA